MEPSSYPATYSVFGPYSVPDSSTELAANPMSAASYADEYLKSIDVQSVAMFEENFRHQSGLDRQSWKMLCEWLFLVKEEHTDVEDLSKKIIALAFSHTPQIYHAIVETLKPVADADFVLRKALTTSTACNEAGILDTIQILADMLESSHISRRLLPAECILGFSPSILSTGHTPLLDISNREQLEYSIEKEQGLGGLGLKWTSEYSTSYHWFFQPDAPDVLSLQIESLESRKIKKREGCYLYKVIDRLHQKADGFKLHNSVGRLVHLLRLCISTTLL